MSDQYHLWEFGLSEYDPFNPTAMPGNGNRLYDETLNVVEALIKQTLAMRRIASVPEVQRSAESLNRLFVYVQTYTPPSTRQEPRFLSLYAQNQSIQGLMYFERKEYAQALRLFEQMYQTAQHVDDSVLQVHALQKLGVELNRAHRKAEAIQALELARDLSFQASKPVAAFANAYLAHIYAASGDAVRFERAIETAQAIAMSLGSTYGDGTDFVVHKFSSILQMRCRGYLRTDQPRKALALHDSLRRQIYADGNLWLSFRADLNQARAYLQLGELEACIGSAREYFNDVAGWGSPHRSGRGQELLQDMDASGYGDEPLVRDFREELLSRFDFH